MPQRLTISIPQPCHESWARMTPAAQGRHCAACAKVVLDFTQKTDAEILALLQHAAAPCGRFRQDQLGRPLLPQAPPAPRWRVWVAAAAAVLGLREVAAGQQLAPPTELPTYDQYKPSLQPQTEASADDTSGVVVRGQVTDASTGEGLPGVTVLLRGTTIGVSTSHDGTFALRIPASQQLEATLMITVSFIGYETRTVRLQELRQMAAPIIMQMDTRQLGGMVVVAGGYHPKPWPWHPRALWDRMRNAFQR